MRAQFRVFDCNRHVVEPRDLWSTRLGPSHTGAVVVGNARLDEIKVRGRAVVRDAANYFLHPAYRQVMADTVRADFTSESNLADMDREGVDAALLLPTLGLYVPWADHIGPDLAVPICESYNNWLHEYCQASPERLKGVALLPLQDPEAAARELRRAVEKLGFVAGLIVPNPIIGRKLHDKAYDALYSEAQVLGVPLLVHEPPPGMALHQIGRDRYASAFAREAAVPTFEAWIAVASFMGHNLLERFPRLSVGFVGAGCGWLPYWLERLEEHWGGPFGVDSPSTLPPDYLFKTVDRWWRLYYDSAPSTLPPDYLFKRQGFAACDPWESTLPEVIEVLGDSSIVWGSCYPRPEVLNLFPNELDNIVHNALLSESTKGKILWDNAARWFGLPS